MTKPQGEVVIENDLGEPVVRIAVKDGLAHGHCEWFDGMGRRVVYGLFVDGAPDVGTFLNWSERFPEVPSSDPYGLEVYAQDWVTRFEAGFLSELPAYETLIDAYCRGKPIARDEPPDA